MIANQRNGVLCVGRVYCDVIFTGLDKLPVLGEEHFASGVSLHAGGGAFITAAYLSVLNRPVSLLATLPGGAFSTIIHKELRGHNINADHCVSAADENDPQLTVALAMAGERAFVTKKSGNALPVERIDWAQMPDITHLHVGELATLAEYPSLVTDAHNAEITVSVDCGWDDELLQRSDLGKVIRAVDIFLPNLAEYQQLQQCGFVADTVSLCVIKQGPSGAMAHCSGKSITSPARSAAVVDTTGAGDAFNAGFIQGWLEKQSIEACLELGNTCGAKAVESVGGAVNLSAWKR